MRLRIPKYENIKALNYEYLDRTVSQYYKPLLRSAMRKRLKMARKLLGDNKVDKILDTGYGGGTFLLELSTRCNNLYGIDIHSEEEAVQAMLTQEGISAVLSQASILNIPYPDAFFDRVVCMSVLEHLVGEELKKSNRGDETGI
ncbi:class I SAM-dependent methyltransferase, partial [bacterium]|nr:class I SAM-dependent methyltransferase [bacterium]